MLKLFHLFIYFYLFIYLFIIYFIYCMPWKLIFIGKRVTSQHNNKYVQTHTQVLKQNQSHTTFDTYSSFDNILLIHEFIVQGLVCCVLWPVYLGVTLDRTLSFKTMWRRQRVRCAQETTSWANSWVLPGEPDRLCLFMFDHDVISCIIWGYV